MIPSNKKPLDVAITTYNEFKDEIPAVMKQFDMKMEELRNSGELEKRYEKASRGKPLKRVELKQSSQTISGVYKKMEKNNGKDTHGRISNI